MAFCEVNSQEMVGSCCFSLGFTLNLPNNDPFCRYIIISGEIVYILYRERVYNIIPL